MSIYRIIRFIKFAIIAIIVLTIIANLPEISHSINVMKQNIKMFIYEITHV